MTSFDDYFRLACKNLRINISPKDLTSIHTQIQIQIIHTLLEYKASINNKGDINDTHKTPVSS